MGPFYFRSSLCVSLNEFGYVVYASSGGFALLFVSIFLQESQMPFGIHKVGHIMETK
jgi:Zn-dependent protease